MKQRRIEDYGNMVQRLYARDTAAENRVCCRNITFQVTRVQSQVLILL